MTNVTMHQPFHGLRTPCKTRVVYWDNDSETAYCQICGGCVGGNSPEMAVSVCECPTVAMPCPKSNDFDPFTDDAGPGMGQ